jgi:four helix bundle protein
MPVRRVQDLIIWQVAREVAAEIYRQTLDEAFERDPHLRADLRRRARAIMTHIAVGYEADTPTGFARSFTRAAEAAADLVSLVQLTTDLEMLGRPALAGMFTKVAEISRLIKGWQRALRTHRLARRLTSMRVN